MIIDYEPHDDESMREEQADLWLGFSHQELRRFALGAGLTDVQVQRVPAAFRGSGPDRHLSWQLCSARRQAAAP